MPNEKSIEALLNSAKARKRPGVDRKIKLTAENEAIARAIGNGSITDGIDKLFDLLPILERLKTATEMLSSNHPEANSCIKAALTELINFPHINKND